MLSYIIVQNPYMNIKIKSTYHWRKAIESGNVFHCLFSVYLDPEEDKQQ